MLSYVKMEQSPEIEETLYCECDCRELMARMCRGVLVLMKF